MKLFYSPGACSLSPHIVLEELGLNYETEAVNLKARKTASGGDYLAINAKGYVPALQLDDGEVLTEGPAIVQYLADLHPEKQLAPPNGSRERYRLQSWLTFIGTEVHKQFSPLFNPAASEEWRSQARANLERRAAWINEQLEGRDYLMGAHFSVADAYLFTVLSWARHVKLDLGMHANIQAFLARVAGRPAVQSVLKAEKLV